MKYLVFSVVALIIYSVSGASPPDYRPKFDKSAYIRTAWTQVNPWWPPNKARRDDSGGANYAYKIYSDNPIEYWGEAIQECVKYGLTGWQLELLTRGNGNAHEIKTILAAAKRINSSFTFSIFLTSTEPKKDIVKDTIKQLKILEKELKEHPNIYRLNGVPVISVYLPHRMTPEEWGEAIKAVEKECGKFIWLCNNFIGPATSSPEKAVEFARKYLPYFDGISQYACWGDEYQKKMFELLAPLMHDKYPQKIFEAAVHNTFNVHFHYGGSDSKLSQKYRSSWNTVLNAKPDAVVLTNLFDHYENSLILPCYEREDFLLRYAQYQLTQWRHEKFSVSDIPELVLTNYISIVIGRKKLEFEIIAFPLKSDDPNISVTVELADSSGKIVHEFPSKKLKLDKIRVVRYSVASEKFANLRLILPRIVYKRFGRTIRTRFNPPTDLNPSMRTNMLYWANSTRNALQVKAKSLSWTLNSLGPGSTVKYPKCGVGVFGADFKPIRYDSNKVFRIMRNGMEHYTHRTFLSGRRAVMLAEPSGALNYYHLEMENKNGNRVRTLPIWVSNDSRPVKVKMPFILKDGKIADIEIEKARVPYFYYPINYDAGNLLVDTSGYMHNGLLNGTKLQCTGLYHYHNGVTNYYDGLVPNPKFSKDKNGRGMLSLDGNDHIMIMGGTAFPGASTYEILLRPRKLGKRQGVFGTANNQINVVIEPDGKVKAWRGSESEGESSSKPKRKFTKEVISQAKLELDKWAHVAIVYDLKKLSLYINGKLEGSVAIAPAEGHDYINHLTVGSLCGWVWNTEGKDKFTGDIRAIRLYGRNLSPKEFLK